MVACVEEVAYKMGFIDADQLRAATRGLESTDYGRYLLRLLEEEDASS